jgi:hypothetical protein
MNTVRNIVLAAAAVAAMVIAAAAPAGADPTDPTPPTPYQIPSNAGPVLGGVQTYPPVCLTAPLACGLRYDPGAGTWDAPSGTGSP